MSSHKHQPHIFHYSLVSSWYSKSELYHPFFDFLNLLYFGFMFLYDWSTVDITYNLCSIYFKISRHALTVPEFSSYSYYFRGCFHSLSIMIFFCNSLLLDAAMWNCIFFFAFARLDSLMSLNIYELRSRWNQLHLLDTCSVFSVKRLSHLLLSCWFAEFLGEEELDASVPLQSFEDMAEDDLSSRCCHVYWEFWNWL